MLRQFRAWMVVAAMAAVGISIAGAAHAADAEEGTIFTLWPLLDYRESPQDGFSNLAILGPLIKFQHRKGERITAFRPLFYHTGHERDNSASTDYLYPLAASESTPEVSRFQFLQLVQKNTFRKDEPEGVERDSMFFPFYISGTSRKYGPYTSLFPIYGNIYERFWRDEYHFVLFPLYGSTVKKGTTSRNYLYPIFNTISGDRESGFHVWPLYGQAAKEGVYSRRFVLWPLFMQESKGLDTDNPTEKLFLLPYAATDSPRLTSRTYFWPFVGYSENRSLKETERDFFWPFWWTVRGEQRRVDSYLPIYYHGENKDSTKSWYLWPLLRHDTLASESFRQERERVLYFLYSDVREEWPKDGASRRRVAFWPLFVYDRDNHGVKTFGFPAPVEPILNKPGIERSWAPLWRIYQQKWADNGDSAVTFLWNLYWHESRGDAIAYEFYPLLSYRNEPRVTDVSLLKGLFRYRAAADRKRVSLFWLPFGFSWDVAPPRPKGAQPVPAVGSGS